MGKSLVSCFFLRHSVDDGGQPGSSQPAVSRLRLRAVMAVV